MSKLLITTVSDRLTGCKSLSLEINEEAAKRSFIQAVKNKDALVYANKEDFELLALGTYEPDLALLEVFENPKVLIRGADIAV